MRHLIFIAFLLGGVDSHGQNPLPAENADQIIEALFSGAEYDVNYSELYEMLLQYLSHPLDANKASADQLRSLMILNEEEINSFLAYRTHAGPLLDVHELQAVPGWTPATLVRILPFVTVADPNAAVSTSLLKRMVSQENSYIVVRHERVLEEKKGYRAPDSLQRYAGSPDKVYLRYRSSRANDFSMGITAEKDAGEAVVWNPANRQWGFDFISMHLQLQKKGRIENIIIGDFQCQFGQGLQFGSTYGMGKNSETITTLRRSNIGFLPYTSVNESLFLRGIAISWNLTTHLRVHGFASRKRMDGTTGTSEEEDLVSSVSRTGYHRTPRELKFQNQVEDTDAGVVIQFHTGKLDAGIIAHEKRLSHSLMPTPNPYNQAAWRGKQNLNVGTYLHYSWANLTFFSEMARSAGAGFGVVAGVLGNFSNRVELAWLYRKFSDDYHSFYANAFTEGTLPRNEEGFYWGGKYSPGKAFSFSAYVDVFRFPWLRYRMYRPSEGHEWLARITYVPSRNITLYVQVREEVKIRNLPEQNPRYQPLPGTKTNLWVNCDISIPPGISLKTRLQGSQYDLAGQISRGVAVIQDFTVTGKRWSLTTRYALFDTDDYENRQYVYEQDVWLTASLPAYEGTGVRNYVLFRYQVSQKIDFWIRWARTKFNDRDVISSGTEQIPGNTRNDAKFQIRIRF